MTIRDVNPANNSIFKAGSASSSWRRSMRFGATSGLAVGAVLALLSACGSSSGGNDNGNGTGGAMSTGSGGALSTGGSSSGAPGQGGAAVNGGGASNSGGSGTSTAGVSGGGGFPGGDFFSCPMEKPTAGASCMRLSPSACTYADGGCLCSSGAWSCYSSADCPATAPADAASCTLTGMACNYNDLACTCGMNGWSCQKPCPMTPPAAATACQRPASSTCRYDEGALVGGFGSADTTCACNDGTFKCFSQSDCPADSPSSGAACEFSTLSCSYSAGQCSCSGDGTWSCSMSCPAMQPTEGGACDRITTGSCRYNAGALQMGGGSSDATCTCQDGKFNCISQADCPAAAPATDSMCTGLTGLNCTYTDRQCSCGPNGWSCTTNCPMTPPTKGTACERRSACQYAAGAPVSMGMTADTTCACTDNAFQCYTAADCPATQPMSASECQQPGLTCPYSGQNCRCSASMGAWTCSPAGGGGGGGAGGASGNPRGGASNAGGANNGGASTAGANNGGASTAGATNGGASTAGVSGSN